VAPQNSDTSGMSSDGSKLKRSIVIWQATKFTPLSIHTARRSAIWATPLSLIVRLIRVVASDSNPGTVDYTAFGIFQSMLRSHWGPNGIFIGIPGLPRGLTFSEDRSLRSRFSP